MINYQQSIKNLEKISNELRLRIVELTYLSKKNGAHIGGSLSSVETLVTLYHSIILNRPNGLEERDRVILSKGHAALGLYCALESIGLISKEALDTFEDNGSQFLAHAKRDIMKGLEFSGGSLGLGISYAVGVALACKDKGLNNQIFVLLGDGECDEGLVWEALMCANNFNLTNFTVIVDYNHLQSDGPTEEVMNLESLHDKFSAFGFKTIEVDGHSIKDLMVAFNERSEFKPNAIIARTIKGKGVSFMENKRTWHHGSLSDTQYKRAIEELNNWNCTDGE